MGLVILVDKSEDRVALGNSTFDCVVSYLIENYKINDVCLDEFLSNFEIEGLSISEVHEVYVKVRKIVDGVE